MSEGEEGEGISSLLLECFTYPELLFDFLPR